MKILEPLVRRRTADVEERLLTPAHFGFNGNSYAYGGTTSSSPDEPDGNFLGYIAGVHQRNGVVAAAVEARAALMSQLRFQYRRTQGNVGELWGDRSLAIVENPASMTRPAFLHQLELDASYAGAAHIAKDDNGQLIRLRPDRCTFMLGSDSDPEWHGEDDMRLPYDAKVVALLYNPETNAWDDSNAVQVFWPDEFTTWAPEPDPVNFWRGTSWVTSVMREIVTDGQATNHTSRFFENAATPNLVFLMDPSKTALETQEYAKVLNEKHAGAGNAYRNMFLGGGTDVKVVGSTLEHLNLKDLQGGLENRVAVRSRVPAVILGIREGLSGSSLNAGNYSSARRMFSDGWFAPTADSLCAALDRLVGSPGGSELSHDPARILFLQEDQKDAADIQSTQATAMRQLIDGGFEPDSVVAAIKTGDMSKLKHTGNVSVQLQPPGTGQEEAPNDDDNDV